MHVFAIFVENMMDFDKFDRQLQHFWRNTSEKYLLVQHDSSLKVQTVAKYQQIYGYIIDLAIDPKYFYFQPFFIRKYTSSIKKL